jgi:DNA-directed RNA polymerase specialized sigma24 family protein
VPATPTARSALFERVAPGTLALIRRLVAQRAMAEDLLQDTLIAMFEHLDDYRGEAPFGAWVRSIAVSRCLMAFRSPWHRARVALESWTEDELADPRSRGPHSDLIDLDRALARCRRDARGGLALRRRRLDARRDRQRIRSHREFFQVAAGAGHARLRDVLHAPAQSGVGIR